MLRKRLQEIQEEYPFKKLNECVYDALYQSIIDLSLAPGSVLSETTLADQMGLSRTPVRNALFQLQSVGLITQNKGQAFQVTPLQRDDCQRLMEVRAIIEGNAAFLAAERSTERERRGIKSSLNAYIEAYKAWNIGSIVDSDHRFHQLVVAASHNELLSELYDHIAPRVLHYRFYLFHQAEESVLRPIMGISVRHHQAVYHALDMGFSGAAKECMEKDISGMVDIMSNW